MTAARPATAFWDFSLAFYALPDVAEACLELQDRHGLDVNVLLYLLFLALSGRRLAPNEVDRIDELASPWRDAVVAPLRGVRRALKARVGAFEPEAGAALRSEVKRIELAAERLQQETLERLAAPQTLGTGCGDPGACARAHVECYARRMQAPWDEPMERILARFEEFAGERHRDGAAGGLSGSQE